VPGSHGDNSKMLNKCPFNRRQNWQSDGAFFIVIGRLFQICGAATRIARAAVTVFVDSMGLLIKYCLKTQRSSRQVVHVNTVVVDEVKPCISSQQSCTEFVVRSATNVARYEAVKTNCSIVHCTPLAQVISGRAVNGRHFCSGSE